MLNSLGKIKNSVQTQELHLTLSVGVMLGLLVLPACVGPAADKQGGTGIRGQGEIEPAPHSVLPAHTQIGVYEVPTYAPCDPPCWRGVTPGKSTEQDAINVIRELPGYHRKSGVDEGVAWSLLTWPSGVPLPRDSTRAPFGASDAIWVENDIVVRIEIYNDKDNTTMQQIVDRYGPPDKVKSITDPHYQFGYGLQVLYLQKGIMVESAQGILPNEGLERTAKVIGYHYFAPTTWEGYKARAGQADFEANFEDWDGFR